MIYVTAASQTRASAEFDVPGPVTTSDKTEPATFQIIEPPKDGWEDIPFRPGDSSDETIQQRCDPSSANTVRGWPSVGGIIVAESRSSAELDYLEVDRFEVTRRASDQAEEDEFCKKLRKVGGKWWEDHFEWYMATQMKLRMLYPDEREILYLGWPEKGGVWVLRWDNIRSKTGPSTTRVFNAHTMEERCRGIQLSGGTFYENPTDCKYVRPLLESFGEHRPRKDLTIEDGGWWDHDQPQYLPSDDEISVEVPKQDDTYSL